MPIESPDPRQLGKIEIHTDNGASTLLGDTCLPKLADGRRAVTYFIEQDQNGKPLLPSVDLQASEASIKPLRESFEALVEEISRNPLDFKHTGLKSEANLIITSRKLANDVNAVTDIAPGGQRRITFNSARIFDKTLFEATTVHAFESSFGYPQRKYLAIPADPYFK